MTPRRTLLTTLCAWCRSEVAARRSMGSSEPTTDDTSHGICTECKERERKAMDVAARC